MKNTLLKSLIVVSCLFTGVSQARTVASSGQWIASGGFGLMINPALLLINPQLEYIHPSNHNLTYGPMIQAGLGNFTLFTFSGTVRYAIGNHPHIKPNVEGGLGLALGSAGTSSSVGVHIMFGMGFDYIIDPTVSIGTVVRANLSPPLTTFFASWPIIVGRFRL